MKDFFINKRFNYFKLFTVEVESYLRPFQQRWEEWKQQNFGTGPRSSTYSMNKRPFETTMPFLVCFLLILETNENGRWTCHRVKVKEKMVKRRWFTRQVRNCIEMMQIKATDWQTSLPVSIQRLLQNKATINRTEVCWVIDFVSLYERYLVMVGSASETFFRWATVFTGWCSRWLIDYLSAVATCLRPLPSPKSLWSSCLDTADLLSLFFCQFSLPSFTLPWVECFVSSTV